LHFDLVHACDPRFRGGTAAALRGEVAAAAAWGVRAAVQPFLALSGGSLLSYDPRLTGLLDLTGIPLLDAETPATCDILLAHHPLVFQHMADRPVRLRPSRVVLVLHHPPFDASGKVQYDLDRVMRALERLYAAPVFLAPVSGAVRAQLDRLDLRQAQVLAHDLTNIVNLADWPLRNDRPAADLADRVVLGRHSRNDPMKWPTSAAEIAACWPNQPGIDVRVLGEAHLPQGMVVPPNWTVLPFTDAGVLRFLHGLDFYVYFHHPNWVEAFGLAIAEAMATGLVTILPPHFQPIFRSGALYANPHEVPDVIQRLRSRPDEYARQSHLARRMIEEHHSVAAYKGRLQRLWSDVGLSFPDPLARTASPADAVSIPPRSQTPSVVAHRFAEPPARQRVLMICGNGIGLGHVTRLLAISRRLPPWIEPIILTLSPAVSLLRAEGLSADYFASHSRNGITSASWNEAFAVEVQAAIDASGAKLALFDGNDAFPGIAKLITARPDVLWLWIRRGLWQAHHRLNANTEPLFNMVIEPAELAADEDAGPTAGLGGVVRVGPVLYCNPEDRLDRQAAARVLGIDPARRSVALQLGAGRNFDMDTPRSAFLAALARHDVQIVDIANPLARPGPPVDGVLSRPVFPLYPLSRAFDLMVLASGYNSFHEVVYAGMPAVFVPNQDGIMDDQHLRAAYAQTMGLGLCVTASELQRCDAAVTRALSPQFAAEVAARAARLTYTDGAAAISRHIEGQLASIRTARPLAMSLPRH
jgi:hypothetical protein